MRYVDVQITIAMLIETMLSSDMLYLRNTRLINPYFVRERDIKYPSLSVNYLWGNMSAAL